MSVRTVNLATMTTGARADWSDAYECGYVDGVTAGHEQGERSYAQMIEDLARHYVRLIHLNEEIERSLAATLAAGPFDELEERRGRPLRAAAHRRLMAVRGIA